MLGSGWVRGIRFFIVIVFSRLVLRLWFCWLGGGRDGIEYFFLAIWGVSFGLGGFGVEVVGDSFKEWFGDILFYFWI